MKAIERQYFLPLMEGNVIGWKENGAPIYSIEGGQKWSHQTILQRACVVRNQQQRGEVDGKLVDELRREIEAKGGKKAIDAWLKENDPGHSTLSDIEDMDWSGV